jgi:curved DNA-binding protein CbpA
MNIDPYSVIGATPNDSWKDIKKKYKTMILSTHPDKMNGNTEYFNIVHNAYKIIKKEHEIEKQQRQPTASSYSANVNSVPNPTKMKNFSQDKFNTFFEKNRIQENNPYQQGYTKTMKKSLNYQEDVEFITKDKERSVKQQIVVHKNPEGMMSSSFIDQFQHLGVDQIDDFTCSSGVDYMQAHSERADLIDTVQRYDSVDHLESSRSTQSMFISEEEKIEIESNKRHALRLEQIRRSKQRQCDTQIDQQFTKLNKRISFV